jgi:hypothetical protein
MAITIFKLAFYATVNEIIRKCSIKVETTGSEVLALPNPTLSPAQVYNEGH